jgi:hypothetical protein
MLMTSKKINRGRANILVDLNANQTQFSYLNNFLEFFLFSLCLILMSKVEKNRSIF